VGWYRVCTLYDRKWLSTIGVQILVGGVVVVGSDESSAVSGV